MIWLGASWFFQDILQVFLSQNVLVPEYFLLFLLYKTLTNDGEDKLSIWIAFAGGFFWDLRWTGLLGMSSGLYISIVLLLNWVWHLFPSSGRTPVLFSLMIWSGSVSTYLARTFVWDISVRSFSSGFLVQQLSVIPLVVIMGACYNWKAASQND